MSPTLEPPASNNKSEPQKYETMKSPLLGYQDEDDIYDNMDLDVDKPGITRDQDSGIVENGPEEGRGRSVQSDQSLGSEPTDVSMIVMEYV